MRKILGQPRLRQTPQQLRRLCVVEESALGRLVEKATCSWMPQKCVGLHSASIFAPRLFDCQRRFLSSAPSYSYLLRSMVKPFLLKCHPDVHSSDAAKKINLKAIQNLNSYLDTLQSVAEGNISRQPDSQIVEVDFIVQLEQQAAIKKKLVTNTSRRKVELLLPPWTLCQNIQRKQDAAMHLLQLERHVFSQISRLLKVAGMSMPADIPTEILDKEENLHTLNQDGTFRRPQHEYKHSRKNLYEQNRDRFTGSIDWTKVDKLYQEAVADMHADLATDGLIRNNPDRRRKLVAEMLARVRLQEEISVVEQLIAFRRMSLLLEANFDELRLEEFGSFWDKMILVLTPARQYNVSGSALHKRRQRHGDNGFSFTLHPDYSVTVQVPIDFQDEEFIRELDRNLWDFYDVVGDGMDDIMKDLIV